MTTKISIIHPIDPLGPKIGGAESFIKGFVKYAPDDFEVEYIGITSDPGKRPPKKWTRLLLGGKEFNFFPLFFEKDENKKSVIPLSLQFTFALRRFKHVFCSKVLFFNRIEPAVLFKNVLCQKIGIVHSDVEKQVLEAKRGIWWNRMPWAYSILERYVFNIFDHIYTVSQNSLEFYKITYPYMREKISFLPTYFDEDFFYPSSESKAIIRERLYKKNFSLPIDNRWILFVGRLQEEKAPLRLIDAFFEYTKLDALPSLIIIGEGNLRASVAKYIEKLNLSKKVLILDSMTQDRLADFYRAADALLLASDFEGMPICVLEALGCGLPVVSTSVGEVRRIVKNDYSGEVVDNFSPKAIAISLEKVLRNPVMYSTNNCLNAVSAYTPKKVLQPVYELIRRLYAKAAKDRDCD